MPVTVFVTAHNDYAVKAFEVHALDYLTKPVEPERLQTTLLRVKERVASQAALMTQEQLKAVLNTLSNGAVNVESIPNDLLFTMGQRILLSTWKRLNGFEAADYYSCLHVGSKNLMLRGDDQATRGDS